MTTYSLGFGTTDDGRPFEVAVLLHRGVSLECDADEGFHASAGAGVHFGYCNTLDELRAEIDDHFAEEESSVFPLDTPSLDTSFHDHEMDLS